MLYSCICSCNVLGAECRRDGGRGPRLRAEGRGTQNPQKTQIFHVLRGRYFVMAE